ATQNEINGEQANILVKTGCKIVAEGANMPSTPDAIDVYLKNNIYYGPAKAANAGGVATSGLEMSQNSIRMSWSFEETDAKLKGIMKAAYDSSKNAAIEYGDPMNLQKGANIAGFMKVARSMLAQGIW
ncbi:NADP-specific glutamate dehydrogenase, partial [Myxococcota bacterium]|nr:NADP-specific glutamate dehydrogenase [Myxococcota bacterium]